MKKNVNRALVAKKKFSKISLTLLAGLLLTFAFPVQTWAFSTYYSKLTASSGDGKGCVYAGTESTATPSWSNESSSSGTKQSSNSGQTDAFYAWAKPMRGSVFNEWSGSGTYSISGSSNPYTIQVKESTSDGKTNIGTVTAKWTTYQPCTVYLHSSSDGAYSLNYKYTDWAETDFQDFDKTKPISVGGETAQLTLYHTDLVTLTVESGDFQGWYQDEKYSQELTNVIRSGPSYTLTVPGSETEVTELHIYPKFATKPKLYGQLNVAYTYGSADGAGQIAVTEVESATPDYSYNPCSLLHTSIVEVGTTSADQTYYLHAKTTNDEQNYFVGWYDSKMPSLTPLSTDKDYAYSFAASSTDESRPTEQTIYAMFVRINMHYFEMTAEPQTPGLGMVLVAQNNEQTPGYNAYSNYSQVLAEEIGLADRAVETNFYLYATPKYGYQFDGWYSDAACTNKLSAANPYTYAASANSTDPNNPDKAHVYAKFKIATPFNVTFEKPTTPGNYAASIRDIVASDGEYVWGDIEIFNSTNESSNKTLSMFPTSNLVLKATADDGNSIKSWKIGSSTVTTGASVYTTSATATTTFGATFGASSPFKVGSTTYSTLAAAIANLGTNKQITVVEDATVAPGNYTIPSGVTLLVPYDDGNTLKTTKPSITSSTTNTSPTNGCFRTLTLLPSVNITVRGAISVGGDMQSRSGGKAQSGCIYSAFGKIDMLGNSTMTIKNGGSLYVWGYIMSSDYKTNGNKYLSSIIAENGSTVYEAFQFENHGGTCLSNTYKSVFLVNQYYVQNIETPLILQYGATEKVYGAMYIQGNQETSATLIGTGGLFVMNNSSSYMRKYFDPVNDRQVYEAYGDISMSSITVKASVGSISSSSYVLPVTNNMSITIKSGSRVTITYDASLLAETQVEIEQGAEMIVSKNLFVYDAQEWCYFEGSAVKYGMAGCVAPLTYSGFNGTNQPNIRKSKTTPTNMLDAKITNNGTIIVNGYLLTTTSGANICSTGSGKIVFPKGGRATSTALKQVPGTESKTNTISTTPAQLHNGNGTYVQTAGAEANTTYTYFLGEWKKNLTIDGCFAVDDAGHKYISTEKGYKDVIVSEIYTAAWVSRDAISVLYIHTADNCDWLEVHTMTDNTIYLQDAEGNIYEYSSSNGYWVPATQYTATFKNFNDKVLYTTKVLPNGTPVYAGPTPIRTADDAGEYTFTGWNPAIGAINVDTYYIAQYARTSNVVSVSVTGSTFYFTTWSAALDFANSLTSNPTIKLLDNISGLTANQTITKSMTIDLNGHELAGSAPLFKVNASDANVTLTSGVVGGKLNATQVATVTAGSFAITGGYFNAAENLLTPYVQDPYAVLPLTGVEGYSHWVGIAYTITFVDGDGKTIQSSKWAQGAMPSYSGAIPTKTATAEYTYTFKGWDKEIVPVTGAATYTATFTATAVPTTAKYTVKHYKLHIKNGEKFAEPFKTDESEDVEIGTKVTPEFEEIEGYDNPAKQQTITISANPNENVVIYEYSISKTNKLEVEGDTTTINDSTEAYTVVLAPGKTMNITGAGSVTAQNLVLQSVPGDNTGANLATTSNLDILGDVCIEIVMNKSGKMNDKLYYCFSVPFNVNVDDGVKRLNETNGNWESAELNTNYRVYTYNEADRATYGRSDNNWTLFNGDQFLPGVFYLCEFDNSNYNRYRFYAVEGASLNNKGDIEVTRSSENEKNGGWNGVANNGLTNNKLSGDFTIIQTLNSVKNSFESAEASKTPLAIGNAAMVQVSKEGSVVVGATPSAVAARRMGEAASTEFINVRLYKENQDQHVDQIFIRASEDASEQYVAGIDLSKATMGTPKVARLWVNDYNLQLVANEALMTNDQATFSLGMSAPANGEYIIALNEVPNNATIYLTENGSAIWNLNIAPAPISLSKGTENSYGLRLVHKINNVVTGFDEAVLNGNVQKVILNDHLYIIRDGKVYSAHGHVIK